MRVYVRCRPLSSYEQTLTIRNTHNNTVTTSKMDGIEQSTTTIAVTTTPSGNLHDNTEDIVVDKMIENDHLSREKITSDHSGSITNAAIEVDALLDLALDADVAVAVDGDVNKNHHHTRLKIHSSLCGTRRMEFDRVFVDNTTQEQIFQVNWCIYFVVVLLLLLLLLLHCM